MDYSDRVNSKKGAGAIADHHEANIHKRQRVSELLSSTLINLDNDPYVFRNNLGFLECKLCLTIHKDDSSYIVHVSGRKHQLNLERRRLIDEKGKVIKLNGISINNTTKKHWQKIGKPSFKVNKIRSGHQLGLLINLKFPKLITEPFFRLQNYFEFNVKNQNMVTSFLHKIDRDDDATSDRHQADTTSPPDASNYQYLTFCCEPYDNVCLIIPNNDIDGKVDEISDKFWWYWDNDTKEYYIQLLFK